MKHKPRIRVTYANVVATVALFAALGGSSYAALSITGKQVRDGSLTGRDVHDRSLLARDFKPGQLPPGPKGDPGATGPKGDPGAPGAAGTARAYGLVQPDGSLVRSKNVASVSNPKTGEFCITLAGGIDAAQTGLVATPDNDALGFVEWVSSLKDCAAGTLEVHSFQKTFSKNGSADNDLHSALTVPNNEGFFFVVP